MVVGRLGNIPLKTAGIIKGIKIMKALIPLCCRFLNTSHAHMINIQKCLVEVGQGVRIA
jgi:hypothetical protein